MREQKPPILLTGKLETATARAYYFHADNWDKPEWLPKSQCTIVKENQHDIVMEISAWLADKNGWQE